MAMIRTTKQAMREARQLLRLCLVKGALDEDRVRQVVQAVLQSRQRGYLTLLGYFLRFIKLDRSQHTAKIESAEPIPEHLHNSIQAQLTNLYGPQITTEFALNPALIGGMRIQVGSDVYDGSVRAGLAALERSFGISTADRGNL
jgi:F-type H+-transporting ATPase subunit delta